MTIWDCRTHVCMTSMMSSVERTDLDFKISVALVLREVLKTEGEARGFQHLPRDLANVNE